VPLDRTFRILLVEDNPADVRLTRLALADGSSTRLRVAADGEQALAMLRHEPGFEEVERPDLILLDLNLPKKHGHEVLAEIKGDQRLCSIPVVVFSTSRYHEDIDRSYRLQANAYVAKPRDLEDFLATVRSCEQFWRGLAELPGEAAAEGMAGAAEA
jgi:chemotaxis family two-component system response regulator Rcp1